MSHFNHSKKSALIPRFFYAHNAMLISLNISAKLAASLTYTFFL